MVFSEEIDLKLIRLVKDNPSLYDHDEPLFKDFNAREVIWQKIGDELQRPASECKARWINIRDINRRILRKRLSSEKRIRPYKYDCELSFMRPFYRDILQQCTDVFEDSPPPHHSDNEAALLEYSEPCDYSAAYEYSAPGDSISDEEQKPIITLKRKPKSTVKKKTKRKYQSDDERPVSAAVSEPATQELDPTDTVDAFLLSIGATLRTFSPYHLNLAKSKIFAVVQEHDLEQIVQKNMDGNMKKSNNSPYKSD